MFGPEPWSDVAGRPLSHWDLWLAAVSVSDHDGSLDELEARLVAQLRSLVGHQGAESKLSHLADLRSRLEAAGLTPADLATPEVLADTRVLARARNKVSDDRVEGRAMTPAMVETPRVRLVRRVRYGRWNAFPVDPERCWATAGVSRHADSQGYGTARELTPHTIALTADGERMVLACLWSRAAGPRHRLGDG